MPELRIVLVEPEYELNLGAIARLAANFAQGKLYMVNPKCEIGFTAKMHAKHAEKYLSGAKICKSTKEACEGCVLVVGTSGVLRRHRKLLRNPITPRQLSQRLEGKAGTVALLFGREGIGLSADELQMCDVLCTVPTSPQYPVMNLSHAVGVMLYELTSSGRKLPRGGVEVSEGEMRALAGAFDRLAERRGDKIRNMKKTKLAFRTVFGRAVPSEVEVRCMLSVIQSTLRELDEKGKTKKKDKTGKI